MTTITSMADVVKLHVKYLEDKDSVTMEEIKAAAAFRRKSRLADTSNTKKPKTKEAPSLEEIFGDL